MQLPSLNTPKILSTEGKRWEGGEREEVTPCIKPQGPWTPGTPVLLHPILSHKSEPVSSISSWAEPISWEETFLHTKWYLFDCYGSRNKNLVAFMCLPKELIPQKTTSWLPTLLSKLGPFLAILHPTQGLPPGRKRKLRFTGSVQATGANKNLRAFQRSPALLTHPGSCPLKEQTLIYGC